MVFDQGGTSCLLRDFGFRGLLQRTARLSRLTQQIRVPRTSSRDCQNVLNDCVVFYTVSAIFQPYHGDIVKTGVVSQYVWYMLKSALCSIVRNLVNKKLFSGSPDDKPTNTMITVVLID